MVETKAALTTISFSTYKITLYFNNFKQNKNVMVALKIYGKKVPISSVYLMVKTKAAQPTLPFSTYKITLCFNNYKQNKINIFISKIYK